MAAQDTEQDIDPSERPVGDLAEGGRQLAPPLS
jgi:hypothetical protein